MEGRGDLGNNDHSRKGGKEGREEVFKRTDRFQESLGERDSESFSACVECQLTGTERH